MQASEPVQPAAIEEPYMVPTSALLRQLDPTTLFGNGNPVELDLGCGTGRFLIRRAEKTPTVNYLGVERLRGRARKVAGKAARRGLPNVRLLRVEAGYAVQRMLPPASISTCYIFFPDPWPKRRHHERRLINPAFLDALRTVLTPDGAVHIATDDADYGIAIARAFAATPGFAPIAPFQAAPDEQTSFELLWLGEGRAITRHSYTRAACQYERIAEQGIAGSWPAPTPNRCRFRPRHGDETGS